MYARVVYCPVLAVPCSRGPALCLKGFIILEVNSELKQAKYPVP
jgi:hypothetical protein